MTGVKNFRLWAAGAMIAVLSGCAVGPDYQTPPTALDGFHGQSAIVTRQAPAAAPLDHWWTGFDDPVLDRIIERTLAQNLDLAAALARVQQARAAARSADAQLLPDLDLTAQDTRQRQSLDSPTGALASRLPGYDRYQSDLSTGAAASWEIDLFGELRRGAEAAGAEAQAAEALQAGTRITVAADAADAYFQIRGDQARLAVTQRQIETDAHLLDLVRLRFGRGLAADREVAQAEALLSQARAALQPLQIDLAAQSNRLDVLMGVQPGEMEGELRMPAAIATIPAIAGGERPDDLLRRRPDIVAAERRLAAANARIGVAIADYYPKISLSGLLGVESLSSGSLFKSAAFQPQAAAGLRWRLFDFGKIDAEVAAAKGGEAEALAQYRQSVLRAAEDVENAFTALLQTEAHGAELQREVAALTRARDAAQTAYQAGAIPLTDVLDADRQLLAAQDDLARSHADSAIAAVGSYRALGGGWLL